MHLAVLMPAFDEADRVTATLEGLAACGAAEEVAMTVFVVDDGSAVPVRLADLPPASTTFDAVLARHVVNLGQGAALETARALALAHGESSGVGAPRSNEFDAYVTMDADGQHSPADVLALARAIDEGADVAFGDRFRGRSNVPRARRVLLALARLFECALTGLRLSDAHNGLRAFSPEAMRQIWIRQNRMAHATEITQRVARAPSLKWVEVPVSIRYTDETRKKGQSATGAATILKDLAFRFLFGEAP